MEEKELAWLVSGNEGKGIGDYGYLHPASEELTDPDYYSDTVWLVNRAVSQPEDRVAAMKTSVNLTTLRKTSSASAAEAKSGSYAYWVGDEGVKANQEEMSKIITQFAALTEPATREEVVATHPQATVSGVNMIALFWP